MTAQSRKRHERNQALQNPALPSESRAPAVAAPRHVWLLKGLAAGEPGVQWRITPMPDGQWPPNQRLPRDDSWSWWVRSSCGHQGGRKEWAFYEERWAREYEWIFRDDPCRYTRCPQRRMIENDGRP